MSDYYRGPSGQSIADLGKTLSDAGMTAYDKLTQAEAEGQYLQAYDTFKRGMANFDAQLQTDPNWQDYAQKAQEHDSQLFDSVSEQIKNPLARNQFIRQAQTDRSSHYEAVTRMATQRRLADTWGSLVSSMDQIPRDVQKGLLTPQQAEAKYQGIINTSGLLSGWNQYEAQRMATSGLNQIYQNQLEQEGWNIAYHAQNLQAGLDYVLDPKNSPNLDDSQRRSVKNLLNSVFSESLATQQKQDQDFNQGLLQQAAQLATAGQLTSDIAVQLQAKARGTDRGSISNQIRSMVPQAQRGGAGLTSEEQQANLAKIQAAADALHAQGSITKDEFNRYQAMVTAAMSQGFISPEMARTSHAQIADPDKQTEKDLQQQVTDSTKKGGQLNGHLDLIPEVRSRVADYLAANGGVDPAVAQKAVSGIIDSAVSRSVAGKIADWASYEGIGGGALRFGSEEQLQLGLQSGTAQGPAAMSEGKIDLQPDANGQVDWSKLFPTPTTSANEQQRQYVVQLYGKQLQDFTQRFQSVGVQGVRINEGWLEVYGNDGNWYRPHTYSSGLVKASEWQKFTDGGWQRINP